jgi:hypothetical protein
MAIHSWSAGVFKWYEIYNGRLGVYKRGESGKDAI